ncbi:Gfo/Idh/MocA family protein [Cohnella zeiphila]|uniref:Gfo/Idh/MocA family oxidoreductase n=1 Tax=Cohnella zeiphila TaxID=2761120 RepID=A0A7X0SSH3_9BACL|nr:Gfo/Idh/MocA family oxidoreductase [Cohnella zeiphila]MBB6733068.1 Gfo/Idh/MocA family oxidoreductase [Cohnella zeiphila]
MNFAIIGWGHIAYKHKEAIENVPGARLAAVCDSNPDRLRELEGEPGLSLFTDITRMLEERPDLDVVCVCTPSGLHADHAIRAAAAGKHLIVEKPVALTIEDARAIRKAAFLNGVKAAAVHPNRYRPAIRKLKLALDRGWFGKLSHVSATVRWSRSQAYYDQAPWRGTRAMDGGVLLNQAVHSLDLLLWLAGPVAEVRSVADTRIRRMEAEDAAMAALRFASGTLGVVEASTTVYERNLEESIAVFGEQGCAVVGGPTAHWFKHLNLAALSHEEIVTWKREIDRDPYGTPGHEEIVRDMVEAIRDNRQPSVTLEDGMAAVQLALDIAEGGIRRAEVQRAGGLL